MIEKQDYSRWVECEADGQRATIPPRFYIYYRPLDYNLNTYPDSPPPLNDRQCAVFCALLSYAHNPFKLQTIKFHISHMGFLGLSYSVIRSVLKILEYKGYIKLNLAAYKWQGESTLLCHPHFADRKHFNIRQEDFACNKPLSQLLCDAHLNYRFETEKGINEYATGYPHWKESVVLDRVAVRNYPMFITCGWAYYIPPHAMDRITGGEYTQSQYEDVLKALPQYDKAPTYEYLDYEGQKIYNVTIEEMARVTGVQPCYLLPILYDMGLLRFLWG